MSKKTPHPAWIGLKHLKFKIFYLVTKSEIRRLVAKEAIFISSTVYTTNKQTIPDI